MSLPLESQVSCSIMCRDEGEREMGTCFGSIADKSERHQDCGSRINR